MSLKDQGLPEPTGRRTVGGLIAVAAVSANTVSTQSNCGGLKGAAVHHGLEFMFEAQVKARSKQGGGVCKDARRVMDRRRLPRSEFPIRFVHRQSGRSPSSVAAAARTSRAKPS